MKSAFVYNVNDYAELYDKIVSVKLLDIVIKVFTRNSTYFYLTQR